MTRANVQGRLGALGVVVFLGSIVFIAVGIVGNPWYRFVRIEGGSMAPAISPGDLIVVAPTPSKVEPGMILVMTVAGEVVTHRVVSVNADGTLTTRGDANTVNDAYSTRPVVVDGLYVGTVPWLGHVLPIGAVSDASFLDQAGAATYITVGPWPALDVISTPTPGNEAAPTEAAPTAAPPEPTAAPVDPTPDPTADPTDAPAASASPDPAPTPADTP